MNNSNPLQPDQSLSEAVSNLKKQEEARQEQKTQEAVEPSDEEETGVPEPERGEVTNPEELSKRAEKLVYDIERAKKDEEKEAKKRKQQIENLIKEAKKIRAGMSELGNMSSETRENKKQ